VNAGATTWSEGEIRFSPVYEREFKCLRRWFEGTLEMVSLQPLDLQRHSIGEPFERTARAMSAPLFPGVTEFRGGVMDSQHCKHEPHAIIQTKAYGKICDLCGASV
jgi:hypothetical protein